MGKRLKKYIQYMESFKTTTLNDLSEKELDRLKVDLLTQISFFQHERLIHLIVTALFAILTILSVLSILFIQSTGLYLLTGMFLILLIPYIQHYYILENGVQKLYIYYDMLGQCSVSSQKFMESAVKP